MGASWEHGVSAAAGCGVLGEEDVAEDPHRPGRRRHVHRHHTEQAGGLAEGLHLENVVGRRELEVLACGGATAAGGAAVGRPEAVLGTERSPPMWKVSVGSLSTWSHLIGYCPPNPPLVGSPSAAVSFLTSAVGPTRSEVPVSAMADVLVTSALPPTESESRSNCQYALRDSGT